ncbi:MAG: PAS domain S-box protein [Pirellulales bacterium]
MSGSDDNTKAPADAGLFLPRDADLLDQVHDAMIMVDMKGDVVSWNAAAERMYGYRAEEAVGRDIGFLYFPEDRASLEERLTAPLLERGFHESDERNRCKDGRPIDIALRLSLVRNERGEPVGIVGCSNDITPRRRAERQLQKLYASLEERVRSRTLELESLAQRLRESEATYRDLLDNANDLIQCVAPDGSFVYVNAAWKQTLGYTDEELKELTLFDVIHPESLDHCRAAFCKVLNGEPVPRVEVRFRTKDGRTIIVEGNTNCKFEGGRPVSTRGIFRDITDRKQAEEVVRSKQLLLQQLFDLQEKERKLIAHDIHDGFLQYVVGARMRVETGLARVENEPPQSAEELQAALVLLDQALNEGRRMIGELRPLVIDEEGIVEAIRFLASDKRFCAGLDVKFQAPATFRRLDPMLEGALFRIVQEALTNVKHHSQATSATVRLVEAGNRLVLEIRDEGLGFELDRVASNRFGVRGIEERARLFGGEATIDTAPGKGTRVRVEIPLPPADE